MSNDIHSICLILKFTVIFVKSHQLFQIQEVTLEKEATPNTYEMKYYEIINLKLFITI